MCSTVVQTDIEFSRFTRARGSGVYNSRDSPDPSNHTAAPPERLLLRHPIQHLGLSVRRRMRSGRDGFRSLQCLLHGGLRRGAGRDAIQRDTLERWQRAAVERSSEGGAAGVGDLGVAEVEPKLAAG